MTGQLREIPGDATRPTGDGPAAICHVANDAGRWGAGFVRALDRTFGPAAAQHPYRAWYRDGNHPAASGPFALGQVQAVTVDPARPLQVVSMVAQHGVGRTQGRPPIRYRALASCLDRVADLCLQSGADVHAPRFGTGLAGGSWPVVRALILGHLCRRGVDVTVYELTGPGR